MPRTHTLIPLESIPPYKTACRNVGLRLLGQLPGRGLLGPNPAMECPQGQIVRGRRDNFRVANHLLSKNKTGSCVRSCAPVVAPELSSPTFRKISNDRQLHPLSVVGLKH